MTRDELILALQHLAEHSGDPEADHSAADALLLAYIGDPAVTEAFESIEKWYA